MPARTADGSSDQAARRVVPTKALTTTAGKAFYFPIAHHLFQASSEKWYNRADNRAPRRVSFTRCIGARFMTLGRSGARPASGPARLKNL